MSTAIDTGRMLRFARNCLRDQTDTANAYLLTAKIDRQRGHEQFAQTALRDIEAKSRLLLHHQEHEGRCTVCCTGDDEGWHEFPCATVREVVATFSQHPDYDESWKP
jgi:hypothetical protein